MKFFQSIRKVFASVGIYKPQPLQKNPISVRSALRLLCLALFSSLTFAFFVYEAKTLLEFAESFYIFATSTFLFSILSTYILKTPKIFELLDSMEIEIEERKMIETKLKFSTECFKWFYRRNEGESGVKEILWQNQCKDREMDYSI